LIKGQGKKVEGFVARIQSFAWIDLGFGLKHMIPMWSFSPVEFDGKFSNIYTPGSPPNFNVTGSKLEITRPPYMFEVNGTLDLNIPLHLARLPCKR
jgi:hypothetical protein